MVPTGGAGDNLQEWVLSSVLGSGGRRAHVLGLCGLLCSSNPQPGVYNVLCKSEKVLKGSQVWTF